MSDTPKEPVEPLDDELVEAFAVLKRLQPNVDGKVLFRTTVAKELAALQAANTMLARPGWKRTVSKLLPFAIGTGTGVIATLSFVVFSMNKVGNNGDRLVPAPLTTSEQKGTPSETSSESDDESPTYRIRVTETYLCGIGKVDSVAQLVDKETK